MTTTPWYHQREGLRFECTGCGDCCHRPGLVLLTPVDVLRIADACQMTPDAFRTRYALYSDEGLWVLDVGDDAPCVFLDDEDRCSIHAVKPWQCAAYPFWTEVVATQKAWDKERRQCEGIGRGERVAPNIIDEWLHEDPLGDAAE